MGKGLGKEMGKGLGKEMGKGLGKKMVKGLGKYWERLVVVVLLDGGCCYVGRRNTNMFQIDDSA